MMLPLGHVYPAASVLSLAQLLFLLALGFHFVNGPSSLVEHRATFLISLDEYEDCQLLFLIYSVFPHLHATGFPHEYDEGSMDSDLDNANIQFLFKGKSTNK
jgi:hypothetical protein